MGAEWRCQRCLRCPPYVVRHGVRPTCNRCHAELAAKGLKWCGACDKALPLASFAAAGGKGDGRRGTCRACYAPQRRKIATASVRRWRERNRDHVRAYNRAYKAARRETTRRQRRLCYIRWKLRILTREEP